MFGIIAFITIIAGKKKSLYRIYARYNLVQDIDITLV